jgi:hypothetical protein
MSVSDAAGIVNRLAGKEMAEEIAAEEAEYPPPLALSQTQFATSNPGTLSKCRVLLLTSVVS